MLVRISSPRSGHCNHLKMIGRLARVSQHVGREPKHKTAHLYKPVVWSCSVVGKSFAVPELVDKRVVLIVNHSGGNTERPRVTVVIDDSCALVEELASSHHCDAVICNFIKIEAAKGMR